MSQEERTGWRDGELSKRHRLWGSNCPVADVDQVIFDPWIGGAEPWIEYDDCRVTALVEYKHYRAHISLTSPTCRALADFADQRLQPVPFFICVYAPDPWRFCVIPVNGSSQEVYRGLERKWMSEQLYVRSLYHIRGRSLTPSEQELINGLDAVSSPPLELVGA